MIDKLVPKGKRVRMVLLLIVDILVVQFSSFLGLWLRFDMQVSSIPGGYMDAVVRYAPLYTVVTVAIFFFLRLYSFMWSVEIGRASCKERVFITV